MRRRSMKLLPLASLLVLVGGGAEAGAQLRSGGASLLDVPDAAGLRAGGSLIGLELGAELSRGRRPSYVVSPMGVAIGIGPGELSLALRDGGQPGDSFLPRARLTANIKLHLLEANGLLPALAVQAMGDRLGSGPSFGARLLASTDPARSLRVAAFAGAEQREEGQAGVGPSGGLALAFAFAPTAAAVGSASTGPSGPKLSTALQWLPLAWFRLSLGWERLPSENLNRFTLGFTVEQEPRAPPGSPVDVARAAAAGQPRAPEAEAARPAGPLGERPRMRLRIRPPAPEPELKAPAGAQP